MTLIKHEKIDARKLDHNTLTGIRIRAVSSVQNGESPEQLVKIMGLSRGTIYNWLSKYRHGGWHAIDEGGVSLSLFATKHG